MSRLLTFCFFFLAMHIIYAQTLPDSLNKEINGKKNGYWIVYLDSTLHETTKANAYFITYNLYHKGELIRGSKFNKKAEKAILPASLKEKTAANRPTLLEDTINYLNSKSEINFTEVYKAGIPIAFIQYFNENPKKSTRDVLFFDSLYNNNRNSFLFHTYQRNHLTYRAYAIHQKKWEEQSETYYDVYKTNMHKSLITTGTSIMSRTFIEVGFLHRTMFGRFYNWDKNRLRDYRGSRGIPIGFLFNVKDGNIILAPKIGIWYSFTLLRFDLGLLHYTDFTVNEQRISTGVGLSIDGYFSIQYHYQFLLSSHSGLPLSPHVLSIRFN